jgi:hypothetical protein
MVVGRMAHTPPLTHRTDTKAPKAACADDELLPGSKGVARLRSTRSSIIALNSLATSQPATPIMTSSTA